MPVSRATGTSKARLRVPRSLSVAKSASVGMPPRLGSVAPVRSRNSAARGSQRRQLRSAGVRLPSGGLAMANPPWWSAEDTRLPHPAQWPGWSPEVIYCIYVVYTLVCLAMAPRTGTKDTHILVRVTDELKHAAEQVLDRLDMNTSDAVRLFLQAVVVGQRFPFDINHGLGSPRPPDRRSRLRRKPATVRSSKSPSAKRGITRE